MVLGKTDNELTTKRATRKGRQTAGNFSYRIRLCALVVDMRERTILDIVHRSYCVALGAALVKSNVG